jgi:hypothetical protein
MATSYTAKFSSACSPAAPCIFDNAASQATGAAVAGIGMPNFAGPPTDGTVVAGPNVQRIGGAAYSLQYETNGDPNLP